MGDEAPDNRRMSEFSTLPTRMPLRFSRSREEDPSPTGQENHQAQFYEYYRKVAEEYDKEFLKKYEEDLNTTLIFVSGSHVKVLWICAN